MEVRRCETWKVDKQATRNSLVIPVVIIGVVWDGDWGREPFLTHKMYKLLFQLLITPNKVVQAGRLQAEEME